MFTALRRIFRTGFVTFWRNAFVSLSSIYVITITLFVVGVTIFVDQILDQSLKIIQEQVDINVYFVKDAPEEEIVAIEKMVRAMTDVDEVIYTSKEEILQRYRDENKNDEIGLQALEELGDNPFGGSLTILAHDIEQYENITATLEAHKDRETMVPVIDKISFEDNREAIDTLNTIMRVVEGANFIVKIFLISMTILITFGTVRLVIYTAKEEIAIMRLVGASNMFIRGPFMVQGVMYGVISGVLALLLLYPLLRKMGPATEEYFNGFNVLTYFLENFSSISLTLIGAGVVLGLVSSILAVTRYLRV